MRISDWSSDVCSSDLVSRIPVALDGSCSGLQHFSAMLRDEEGGAAVNLLPAERPQDVYKRVAVRAQEMADATPVYTYTVKRGDDEEEITVNTPWIGEKVTRAKPNRPVMTRAETRSVGKECVRT